MIELPFPSAVLSPNSRNHWAVRARATKAARQTAFLLTKAARLPALTPPVAVAMTFHPAAAHRYDVDGLQSRCKAYFDGIADALGMDDRHFRPVSIIGALKRPGCVVVTLKSFGEAE